MHDPTSSPTTRTADVRALDAHLRALRAELSDLPAPRREELGLPPRGDGSPLVAARAMAASAAVVALVTTAFTLSSHVLASVPWQAGTGQRQADDVPADLVSGSVLAVAPAVVAVLAAALLFVPRGFAAGPGRSLRPAAHVVSWVSALALTAATVVDAGGSGWWWFPAALLAWAAVVVPRRLRRAPSARGMAVRRWLRAAVVLLPVGLWTAAVLVSQGLEPLEGGWTVFYLAVVAALVVTGVLVGLGSRAGHVVLAAAGALVMGLAVAEMGMLVLGVWWSGGVWLLLGLVGLVDGTARSRRSRSALKTSSAT